MAFPNIVVQNVKTLKASRRQSIIEAIWPPPPTPPENRSSDEYGGAGRGRAGLGAPRHAHLLSITPHHLRTSVLSKGSKTGDPSAAYVELWCRSFDYGLVTIKDEDECAFAAGYCGNRAHRTWSAHMTKLVELGVILSRKEGNREFGQVLILNPLAVAAAWQASGKLPDGWWTSFAARAGDIGASIPRPLKLPKDLKRM